MGSMKAGAGARAGIQEPACSRRGEENDNSLDRKYSPRAGSLSAARFGQCLNPPGQGLRCIY